MIHNEPVDARTSHRSHHAIMRLAIPVTIVEIKFRIQTTAAVQSPDTCNTTPNIRDDLGSNSNSNLSLVVHHTTTAATF